MARKAIAGVLLLAVAAWVEMSLAPMLAMHAGHSHRGDSFVADAALQHAAHGHAPQEATTHSCCPPVRKVEAEGTLELLAKDSGCKESHRCCFRDGPQNVPTVASETRELGLQTFSTISLRATVTANASHPISVATRAASPPHEFGMALRV
jgi:hypothetical protein